MLMFAWQHLVSLSPYFPHRERVDSILPGQGMSQRRSRTSEIGEESGKMY